MPHRWRMLAAGALLALTSIAGVTVASPQAAHAGVTPAGENSVATATVYSGTPNQNLCCGATLSTSPTSYRAYLQFPVSIPSGASITSATLNWKNISSGLTSGVEVHLGTATSFNQGPGSGESTCYTDTTPCITWNNQPYGSTAIATSSTPAANSLVSVSIPPADLTPGTSVVFALRSLTSGVIDKISGAFSGDGPTLQISYTGNSTVQSLAGAAYTNATTGNTNTNYGGADPLKTSPTSYYTWLQFNLSSCGVGSCGIPAGAIITGGTLTFYNLTTGEASVDVHAATADNWTPGTGGNTGDTTCYLNTPACLVYSNQPYSSSVLTTYTFSGSSNGVSAAVSIPTANIHTGGFSSFALKGTTSGLIDNIDNGTAGHPATLTIQYSASENQTVPSGLCGGGPQAHVSKYMIVYEENRQASQVYGSSNAPYINSTLATQCGKSTNFTARASGGHSLSNYLMSMDGQDYTGLGVPGTSAGTSTNSLCSNNCISTTSCAAGQTAPCWTTGAADTVPGSVNNATTSFYPAHGNSYSTLFDQVGSTGWKSYAESMPSACYIANGGADSSGTAYAPRHVPSLYYTSLNGGSTFSGTNCNTGTTMESNAVPLATTTDQTGAYTSGALYTDVTNGTLPKLSTVTPNLCDDMHDNCGGAGDTFTANCGSGNTTDTTCVADQWLKGLLTMVTAGPDYQSGNLGIIVVWDEGGSVAAGTTPWPYTCATYSQTCVAALVLSRQTTPGTVSSTAFNDWSITRTIDDGLGLTELGNSSTVNSMRPDFGL